MSHQDGRCASDAESVVVTGTSANLPSTSVLSGIRLVVIRGSVNGTLAWSLPASPQMTIVGQASGTTVGTLAGPASTSTETATIRVTGGDLYIRRLSVTGGSPGIWATGGNVLRLDHATVSNNTAGGILLDGAGFDIRNTTVNDNIANSFDQIFGGIRIQGLSSSAGVPRTIAFSTVSGNQFVGVSCASGTSAILVPPPTTILALAPSGAIDINGACGFSSCGTASSTCGAQP